MQSGFDIDELFQEAQSRWLKPAEVLFILQNHEKYKVTPEPPQLPVSGSLFLFNKRILRFFRRDGHNWRKKRDGRTVGEAHERLKVGNVETLNCYYAHGEDNPNFQRRSYWILDPAFDHIVLVHYRDISGVRPSPGSFIKSPPVSSSLYSQSPISNTTQHPGPVSMISELHELYTSPGSVEVSSDIVIEKNRRESVDARCIGESDSADVSQALRRLKEQLSLNDDSVSGFVADNPNGSDVPEFYGDQFTVFNEQEPIVHDQLYDGHSMMLGTDENSLDILDYHGDIANEDPFTSFREPEHIVNDQFYSAHSQMHSNVDLTGKHRQSNYRESSDGNKGSTPWKEVLSSSKTSPILKPQETGLSTMDRTEKLTSSISGPNVAFEYPSLSRPQEVDSFKMSPYPAVIETSPDYFTSFFQHGNMDILGSDINLTVAQKQKFTIREISPEWGYANEPTKVIVIGSFLCDPSESAWSCMFGDVEVPAQIIQDGVIRCVAPPHLPGKVTLCITSGNRDSCSEVRDFEYRFNSTSFSPPEESRRSADQLLLLVRFAQILLSDSSLQNKSSEFIWKSEADDDTWNSIIEALLAGSGSSSSTMYWLLEEFLQDKLQQWLSSRTEGFDQTECSLSKKEQGIIHMIVGLGFEWALNPLLNLGVNINFRDINGWTALHWAARFGREKMVAVLVASGASAGAVTDPSCQDPIGKTPASVAAIHGHKGLAGYLSEVALTSHLSSLTLAESEVSRDFAELEAELTMNSISNGNLETNEDPAPLQNTLAAVWNASQAAARIQSAFRAHSFRKRQQKELSNTLLPSKNRKSQPSRRPLVIKTERAGLATLHAGHMPRVRDIGRKLQMSRAEMGSKELDQNVELVDTAIRRLLEERKSRGSTGDVRDDEDHLLHSRLLSQLDSLKGNVNETNEIHEAEAVAETAATSEGGGAELVAAKAENGEEFDKEEIVKELNKLKRQNTITHWLLSVMIVLIVAWQASEVTLLWKVRNGLSNPFTRLGGLFSNLFQGKFSDQNGHHEKHKTLKTDAFEFKMPEIKSTEIVGISSEEH